MERAKALSHAAKFSNRRRLGRLGRRDGPVDAPPEIVVELARSQTYRALIVPWKGNSDPFESTAVPITPRMHQAFEFLRDALIPTTHFNDGTKKPPWSRNFLPARTVRKHVESMSDEWKALGEMLPLSAALARLSGSQELHYRLTKSKTKVLRRLQNEIAAHQDAQIRDHVIGLTRTLFAAATFENNFAEARLHGIALRRLLYQKSGIEGIESIDSSIIWSTLYYDAQIAHSKLDRSIFDVEVWAPFALQTAAKPVFEFFAPLRDKLGDMLDPDLNSTPLLKDICIDFHQIVWLWQQSEPLSSSIDGQTMNLYATYTHNILQLRLSNHFVQLRDDDIAVGRTSNDLKHISTYTEAALTLSLIAYLALFVGNPRIGGQYMWPRVRLFISQLHIYLQRASKQQHYTRFSEQIDHVYGGGSVLLFAYWVGATWEHNDAFITADVAPWWFSRRFAQLARILGLHDWESVRTVLDCFVPSRFARPRGEGWVDDVFLNILEDGEDDFS